MNEHPMAGTDPNPDGLSFLPIDPFAARRDTASRVIGLGGDHPSDDPGYVFQSLDIFPVIGPVRFTLHFYGLAATSGTLTLRIHVFSCYSGTARMLLREVSVPMRTVTEQDGIFIVELISRRNMGYTISGAINDDTDARAMALNLSLDPRERDTPLPDAAPLRLVVPAPAISRTDNWIERPELATVQPAFLASPVSQAMTARQARDPLVTAWNAALYQSGGDAAQRWENAFVLQALRYYGIATDAGSGLGIGWPGRRLPAYLAGCGCSVLVAATRRDDLPEGDPGLALEQLAYPELCAPRRFFDAVNLTVFEDLAIPLGLAGFDFLWSVDVQRGAGDRSRVPAMLRDAMGCLRPGGIAVHLLRYSGELDPPSPSGLASFARAEIERMALSLVADGQEVAQLNFEIDGLDAPGDRAIPFALIARRIR